MGDKIVFWITKVAKEFPTEVIGTSLIELILLPDGIAKLKKKQHAIYDTARVIGVLSEMGTKVASKHVQFESLRNSLRKSSIGKSLRQISTKSTKPKKEENKKLGKIMADLDKKLAKISDKSPRKEPLSRLRDAVLNDGLLNLREKYQKRPNIERPIINRVTKSEPLKKESKSGRPEPTSDPPASWYHGNQTYTDLSSGWKFGHTTGKYYRFENGKIVEIQSGRRRLPEESRRDNSAVGRLKRTMMILQSRALAKNKSGLRLQSPSTPTSNVVTSRSEQPRGPQEPTSEPPKSWKKRILKIKEERYQVKEANPTIDPIVPTVEPTQEPSVKPTRRNENYIDLPSSPGWKLDLTTRKYCRFENGEIVETEILPPLRRRLSPPPGSRKCDSPVLVRLLEEIEDARQRS